jgi:hypothetical protein
MKDWEKVLGKSKGKTLNTDSIFPKSPSKRKDEVNIVSSNVKKFRLSALDGEQVLQHNEGNVHTMPRIPEVTVQKKVSRGDRTLRSILGE